MKKSIYAALLGSLVIVIFTTNGVLDDPVSQGKTELDENEAESIRIDSYSKGSRGRPHSRRSIRNSIYGEFEEKIASYREDYESQAISGEEYNRQWRQAKLSREQALKTRLPEKDYQHYVVHESAAASLVRDLHMAKQLNPEQLEALIRLKHDNDVKELASPSENAKAREKAFANLVREELGDSVAESWARQTDPRWPTIFDESQRLGLSQQQTEYLYQLSTFIADEETRLMSQEANDRLILDGLAEIMNEGRQQLVSYLGPDTTAALMESIVGSYFMPPPPMSNEINE